MHHLHFTVMQCVGLPIFTS